MKYSVYRESFFSAAHHLRNYKGKCENVHGHNWRVRVYVSGPLDKNGFVMDFKDLDKLIAAVADRLDHHDINAVAPFDTLNPTAEHIAAYIYKECETLLAAISANLIIDKVMVWESEKSCAIVER